MQNLFKYEYVASSSIYHIISITIVVNYSVYIMAILPSVAIKIDRVIAFSAYEYVIASTISTYERVVTISTFKYIHTPSTIKIVITISTYEMIMSTFAIELIISLSSIKNAISSTSWHWVISICAMVLVKIVLYLGTFVSILFLVKSKLFNKPHRCIFFLKVYNCFCHICYRLKFIWVYIFI